ncbi:Kinase-like protein [Melia azedarach]|uniref:Kinase-like protein n=1 Tax=Melia azedarach TaxID=155640 RepID=A0ACC1YKJ1_MELAZ|nr:Kinase-like protein [Melia azedarach]
MDDYLAIKEIGGGTYGTVWRAVNKHSWEVVAIKLLKRKYSSWEECLNLQEVKCLRKLNHPNIVQLKELIWEHQTLGFVFEHMECSLYQLIQGRNQLFSEAEVRKWCFQVFQGLNCMHQQGYVHRDLKPENLLVSKDIIKVADFGQAKETNSRPPHTVRISTRWYRAPEVLLKSSVYNTKVDMWAMGAIMAELFTLRPLFPGLNEVDQIHTICNVIGNPTMDTWAEGLHLARNLNYKFPQLAGVELCALMPSASENAISLIRSLCSWDPCKRPTAAEALQHPFFHSGFHVPRPLHLRLAVDATTQSAATNLMLLQQGARAYFGAIPNSMQVNNFPPPGLDTGQELPPMKTGVQWNGESRDLFLSPVQHLEPGRIYNRKVG